MGMWQNLVAGYEANEKLLEQNRFCICTTLKSIKSTGAVVVRLDDASRLIGVEELDSADEFIQLLTTEKSANRAGTTKCSHCLFDEVGYAAEPGEKRDVYLELLRRFCDFARNADADVVLTYQERGTIWDDIQCQGIDKITEKTLVLFSIERPGTSESRLWRSSDIILTWRAFALKESEKTGCGLDVITGSRSSLSMNPGRKVNNMAGNAKLISANDKTNYTYRGKFVNPDEVASIGYESTEKAHQFLRYLIMSRGIKCDTQVLVTWTINADDDLPQPPVTSDEFEFEDEDVAGDEKIELAAKTGIDVAQSIRESLMRGRLKNAFVKHSKTAVLMLDAATDGRMAVVFYRELASEEYLERIAAWHESAAWRLTYSTTTKGEDGKSQPKYHVYVGAPTVDRIIQVVFGRQKSASDDGYKKMKRQMRELIVRAIFDGQPLPGSFIERALSRLSRPLSFIDPKDKYGKQNFMEELAVFCSMLKQNYLINRKEKIEMQLDVNCSDRNYLFGRLLGAADKLEEYALAKGDKDRMVTASIRYMQLFAQRPFTTWGTIHNQLQPYIQKVKGSIAFREIEAIKNAFSKVEDFQNDAPLTALYLLGYYQERNRIAELARAYSEKKENDNQTSNEQE